MLRDGVHDERCLLDAQPRAAIGFRHGHTQPSGIGDGPMKLARKTRRLIALGPVVIAEPGADRGNAVDDCLLLSVDLEHGCLLPSATDLRH